MAQSENTLIVTKPWPHNQDSILKNKLSNQGVAFVGGLELLAPDEKMFGGFSALWCSKHGDTAIVVSDFSLEDSVQKTEKSKWYKISIQYDTKSVIQGVKCISEGQFFNSKEKVIEGEIESMEFYDGTFYLSNDNRRNFGSNILQYKTTSILEKDGNNRWMASEGVIQIKEYPEKDYDEGIEAITITENGDLFVIHEKFPGQKASSPRDGWLIDPKTQSYEKFVYHSRLKEVKGATTLPNGNILILEKTFQKEGDQNMTRIAIILVDKKNLSKGNLSGTTLWEQQNDYLDNFEGISCFERNGEDYLLIVSDNNGDWNYRDPQKSLIWLFKLLNPEN